MKLYPKILFCLILFIAGFAIGECWIQSFDCPIVSFDPFFRPALLEQR